MCKESKWAKGHNGLLSFTPWKSQNETKIIMGCCCLPPDRVKLAVNSKKETNSRVKLGKGSRWASVIYPLKESKWGCCCLPPDRVKLIVNSKKETNSRIKMGKESKWAKGQDGLLFFTPWQSQTSSEQQEKQTAGSKWAKGQNGFLLFTPWKSQNVLLLFTPWQSQTISEQQGQNGLLLFTPWQCQTNSVQQQRNKQQGQNGPQSRWASDIYPLKESKWGFCCLPPERVKLAVNSKKETNSRVKMRKESKLLLFTPWKSQTNNKQQERNKQQGQSGPRVKMGFCYLPHEKVKMGQRSLWAAVVYPLTEWNYSLSLGFWQSFISIEVCRDCIPALASSCKKQLTGFFVCLLFFLKVKRIS